MNLNHYALHPVKLAQM